MSRQYDSIERRKGFAEHIVSIGPPVKARVRKKSVDLVVQYLRMLVAQGWGDRACEVRLDTRAGFTVWWDDELILDGRVSDVLLQLENPWRGMEGVSLSSDERR